jgi:hypothetical protein
VAAFYYPWYGNPEVDGEWIHWDQSAYQPPEAIGSDYYPELGAYSSNDPSVVAQHMAWLRRAGVGVIVVSWWGRGSYEERPVPLILQMAERYGIQVTFHIEPYAGRTADRLAGDVEYLCDAYGGSPAFFRTAAASRYSPGARPKPMFFVWSIEMQEMDGPPVEASYWREAVDAIHALPESPLVIANTLRGDWIDGGHFDGLYNYITLHLDQEGGFGWSRSLPPDSLYVPSVMPGNSARRVGYPESTYVARLDGATYDDQWTAALGTGVEPALLTVTSFNEWHEGSVIEPPALGVEDGHGYTYADFGALPPDGYLTLTRQWVDRYEAMSWPPAVRIRIQLATTSDWTTLDLVSGGFWMRPQLVSASEDLVQASMEAGDRLVLMQSLQAAMDGRQAQMTWDLWISGLDPAGTLVLQIDRGNLGASDLTLFNYPGETPVVVQTAHWSGITFDRNSFLVQVPASVLLDPVP